MLTKIAQQLTAVVLGDHYDEQERMLCEYGCELWLYTVISTIGLLIIGAALGFPFETILIVTIFYLCQSNGGGYHASTHNKCFITMVVGLFIGLQLQKICTQHIYIFFCLGSSFVLLRFPLYLHTNKRYLLQKKTELKKRSRIITSCILLVSLYLNFVKIQKVSYSICIALFLSSISRLYAVTKEKIVNKE